MTLRAAHVNTIIADDERLRVEIGGIRGTTVWRCTNGTVTVQLDNGQMQVAMPWELRVLDVVPVPVPGLRLATVGGRNVRGIG